MVQIIVFSVLVISIFIYTFAKLIKENNAGYVYLLSLEFIGIIVDFIFIFIKKNPNLIFMSILFIVSIIIPIIFLALERKNLYLDELINIARAGKNKEELKKKLLLNIEKHPNSYRSHKMLAKLYEENEEKEKAEGEYLKVININPKDYDTYCKLAEIFHENKKEEESIQLLQNLLSIKPEFYKASVLLGNILFDNERFKEAIVVYNEALKYSPAQYELYYFLGMTYTRLNDFQNAREYYKKAATLNSLKDISNLNLGQIYLIFREYDDAEKYFYECINSEDEKIQANAYLYLAKIQIIKKDLNKAIQYVNLAIEINPSIIKQVEDDYTFSIILGKIKNQKPKEIKSKLTEKELQTINHLGKTYNVVENLTDNLELKKEEREKDF